MILPPTIEAFIASYPELTPAMRLLVEQVVHEACVLQHNLDADHCLGALRAPLVVERETP